MTNRALADRIDEMEKSVIELQRTIKELTERKNELQREIDRVSTRDMFNG